MTGHNLRAGLSLLRQPDVSKLFFAFLVSHMGTAMAPIAVVFGLLELTNSPKDSSIVIAAPTISSILFLLIGGAIADRSSRKSTVIFADILAMSTQFSIAWLFLNDLVSIPILTLFMLVNGIAVALNAPASTALITQLVERDQLIAANALLGTARNGAIAFGAALGGVLVAFFGAGITLAIDAVSFGFSALLVFFIKPKPQIRPEKASLMQDLKIGWKEFTSHTWLWVIVAQFSIVVAASESVFGLLGPAVARDHMQGAEDWGYIAAGFGLGTLSGGILALKIKTLYPMRIATGCVFFFSCLPIALAFPLHVHFVMGAAIINGVALQVFSVLWNTTIQKKIPPQKLSRIIAYDHLGSISLAPLGIVVAGYLFEEIGFRPTLSITALLILLPTAIAFMVKDIRLMTIK